MTAEFVGSDSVARLPSQPPQWCQAKWRSLEIRVAGGVYVCVPLYVFAHGGSRPLHGGKSCKKQVPHQLLIRPTLDSLR